MENKIENGCCLTAVHVPNKGVTVSCCGSRDDLRSAFGVMCMELMNAKQLSYEDMRAALYAALFTSSITAAFRKSP